MDTYRGDVCIRHLGQVATHPPRQEREACRRRTASSAQMHRTETLSEANSVLVLLHRVDVAVVSDISEVDTAAIFRVEVCKMREYLYLYSIMFLKTPWSRGGG
jgi:hypothetical protein